MQNKQKAKNILQTRRANRVRAKVAGTAEKPRLAIFKSSKHLSLQAIDDAAGKTLASAYDKEVKGKTKQETAKLIGELIARKLAEKKITTAVFDKRHHRYHGLVKLAADGAREGGLKF